MQQYKRCLPGQSITCDKDNNTLVTRGKLTKFKAWSIYIIMHRKCGYIKIK